eukprot:gene11515-14652_t
MRFVFAGIVTLLLFTGCVKEKPRAGLYWAEFYTVDGNGFNTTLYDSGVEVTNPTDASITINGSTLSKKGNNVTGSIGQMDPFALTSTGLVINGTWKRKGGYYRITGDYTAFTTNGENF